MKAKILTVLRAERFSPGSVSADAAILRGVAAELRLRGYDTEECREADLGGAATPYRLYEAIATMGRGSEAARVLSAAMADGVQVVNSPESVAACCRRVGMRAIFREMGIPLAPDDGEDGYWVKRADGTSTTCRDVQFAPTRMDAEIVRNSMLEEGAPAVLVEAHVKGDLVKFYGVADKFFRYRYPGDSSRSKFGDELRNGKPHHYAFDTERLRSLAQQMAETVGVDVYGGDCIVGESGEITIIDFNDWPSFSYCKDEAARAIADVIEQRIERV